MAKKTTKTKLMMGLATLLALLEPTHAEENNALPNSFFGTLRIGMQVSAIGDATFDTKSAIGKSILAGCKDGEFCKLRANKDYQTGKLVKFISVAPVPRFTDPTEMLEWVYDQFDDSGGGGSVRLENYKDLVRIYTPPLAKLIAAEVARGTKDQDEAFATVWYQSQEGSPVRRRVKTKMVNSDRAETTVSYDISDYEPGVHRQTVIFYLLNTSDGWRIDEVMYPRMGDKADHLWRRQLFNISKGRYNDP